MHNKVYVLALSLRSRAAGLCHSKGQAKSLSDCSLAYTDKQLFFCEPFQKNL
jgi:hypothetical protein